MFQFLAQPASAKTYTFQVEQTYSDGSIVNWAGSESSEAPAPTIQAADSLGGGSGVSVLTIIALVFGVLGLLAGGEPPVADDGEDHEADQDRGRDEEAERRDVVAEMSLHVRRGQSAR